MKSIQVNYLTDFEVILSNERAQAAVMVLGRGESTGGPDNRHENSDQWMYVALGDGTVVSGGEEIPVTAGSLVLIERGESHEIRNTGETPLETVNIYVPPAY